MLALVLGAGVIMPVVWHPLTASDWQVGLQMGALGLTGGLFIIAAYRTAPAIVVAPMQYSQIVWASALGFLLWGEKPSVASIIGIGVIVAAGLTLLAVAGRQRSQEQRA